MHEGKEKGGSSHARKLIDSVAEKAIRIQGAAGASKWVESRLDGAAKANAMVPIAASFVKEDPEAAAAWAGRFAEDEYAAGLIGKVGEQWGSRNPEATLAWLETLPNGAGSAAGFREVMQNWKNLNPQRNSLLD